MMFLIYFILPKTKEIIRETTEEIINMYAEETTGEESIIKKFNSKSITMTCTRYIPKLYFDKTVHIRFSGFFWSKMCFEITNMPAARAQ